MSTLKIGKNLEVIDTDTRSLIGYIEVSNEDTLSFVPNSYVELYVYEEEQICYLVDELNRNWRY